MKKIYNFFYVALPILSIYKSPIPNLDLGLFIILLLTLVCILCRIKMKITNDVCLWGLYVIYILFSLLMVGENTSIDFSYLIMRTIKNIIYIFILLYSVTSRILEFSILKDCYFKISFFSTVFIMIQSAFYYVLHIPIYGYLVKYVSLESYAQRVIDVTGNSLFRPTSIFYEPSFYFTYVIIALSLALFFNKETMQKDIKYAIFLTVGIILSTSGMGVAFCIILWIIWIVKKTSHSFNVKYFILGCCVIGTTVYVLNSDLGKDILDRVFNQHVVGGNAVLARTDGYNLIKDLSGMNLVFGNGYGNLPETFIPSWAFNIYCLGLFGSFIVLVLYYVMYKKSDNIAIKYIILINFALSIVSTAFNGYYIPFMFSFIYTYVYYRKDLENENMCFVR